MFAIPTNVVAWAKARGPDTYRELIAWRLNGEDVAGLLAVTPRTVHRWSTVGRFGVVLESRTFWDAGRRAPRAYRLIGVERFAGTVDRPVHYDALHPALQREWQVGPLAHHAKHVTLDNLLIERSFR